MRNCPNCKREINGHPNKKFCGSRCKDRYHNINNPRGYYAHMNPERPEYDPEANTHPFSSEALGQS